MLSTLDWARSAGLDVPNHRLGTLMDLIGFEIRVRPMHSTLVGAQAVGPGFRFETSGFRECLVSWFMV